MMAGVRPRLEPGSSESKNRSLHQSCLVGTSLSVGHNALILVVKSGFNSWNGGNLFLDHECFQGDYPLGVHIFRPHPSPLLSHISLLTTIVMHVCDMPLRIHSYCPKSGSSGQHYCFVFGRPWVQISTLRLHVLADVRIFSQSLQYTAG